MLAALLSLAVAAEAAGPNVTLPLEEYEKLRRLRERPSVTVVELLRLEGSFARRDLAVSFSGRAAGTLPTADVLSGEGFRLYACEGDALVTRGDTGAFALTPLAPRFRARCRVALDGSDRLAAQATAAVLEVASGVADGELVASGAGPAGRDFSVVRRLAERPELLPPSVAGCYRVTLLPEETRFAYRLEIRNPNRTHRRFELGLREAEHVEAVNTPVAWDVEGGRYRFDLPPGESIVELDGRLTGETFAPPVDATLQYLLVESHPLLRAEVTSVAKRVGVGEVGLTPRYRGAQAFLLSGRTDVWWKTVRLEALKSAGFAISSLEQVFFLGADGNARGETELVVENQGAPALAIPGAAEPTFASVSREPAFLTRDKAGRLVLPLAQGRQQVLVQDRRPFRARLGLAAVSLELPSVGVPASRARVEVRYPAEWIPVYEELAPVMRQHLVQGGEAVLLVALLVLAERALGLLRLGRGRRWLLACTVTLAAAFTPFVLALGLALAATPLALAGALALVRRLHGLRLGAALPAGSFLAAVAILAAGALFPVARQAPEEGHGVVAAKESRASLGAASLGAANDDSALAAEPEKTLSALRAAQQAAQQAARTAARPDGEPSYEGLPARIEIPRGAHRSFFSRELLATDGPRRVVVVFASTRLAMGLTWGTALLALAIGVLSRRALEAGVRELVGRVTARGGAAAGG